MNKRKFLKNSLIGAATALAVLGFTTTGVFADEDDDLSTKHILYGVSQFWAGIHGDGLRPGRYANPTRRNMVVGTLIYHVINIEDEQAGNDLERVSEKFLSCVVTELTPHAAVILDDGVFEAGIPMPGGFDDDGPYYSEIISAPRDGSIKDGQGILGQDGTQQAPMRALNPKLFSLPSDTVVAGQNQAAIDGLCGGLNALTPPAPQALSGFGIVSAACPAPAVPPDDDDDD